MHGATIKICNNCLDYLHGTSLVIWAQRLGNIKMVNTEIIFQKLNWKHFPQIQVSDRVKSINNCNLDYIQLKYFFTG